jgi:Ca2+-binding RTX toxin-like protein
MVSGVVSVPSHTGPISFTVTGTNTLLYAQNFANAINKALTAGTLGYKDLSDTTQSIPGYTSSSHPSVVEQEISTIGGSYTLAPDTPAGSVYTFDDANGATTITGSGTGDNVLVAGIDAAATYIDMGGNNVVTFVDGNNTYIGPTASGGADSITAGSGNDSIYAGVGAATVDSGTGHALISLQDTLAAGATSNPKSTSASDYTQFAYLDDGQNTVLMNGVADVAVATAPDQAIFGGSGDDLIALVPPAGSTVSATGNDSVVGGSGLTSVYDGSNSNNIYGGSGTLVVAFADSVDGSVVAGAGTTVVYGESGDTIAYFTNATTGGAVFVAGSGSESVDASGSAGSLTLVLGTGNETLIGGSGPTTFNANYDSATGLTGTITIKDFGGSDVFDFVGYSAAQYQAALATGTATSSGYNITLSDGTTVTFAGVTSITGHTTNT